MDSQIWYELESAAWNELNPNRCPCRGSGWLRSDWDTAHRCRTHGANVPHPDAEDDDDTFDMAAHRLANYRYAFYQFRCIAVAHGFKGKGKDFIKACEVMLGTMDRVPSTWVNAAECVAEEYSYNDEELRARRRGYETVFEMHMADEAVIERAEQEQWY